MRLDSPDVAEGLGSDIRHNTSGLLHTHREGIKVGGTNSRREYLGHDDG